MSVRQAVVLAGGRGTRLWPLTESKPKGLIPVAGIPFIEFQLRMLAEASIDEVFLAVGDEHAVEWHAFADEWRDAPSVRIVVEDEPLDTAGPVVGLLQDLDDRFLVLNGDVIFDAPIADFVARAPEAEAVIALVRVDDPSAYGVVVTDPAGMVVRFVEKPAPGSAPTNTVSAGVYLVERSGLDGYSSGPVSFERRVFPDMAARNGLAGVTVEGAWLDIGTPGLYLDTHEAILAGETGLAAGASGHAVAATARVLGERRGGWSWVGAGAIIETGATVRESVILAGATVHPGARVTRSIIGWNSEVLPGATVAGESVVGADAIVGPGCESDSGMRVASGTKLGPRAVSFRPPQ